MEWGSYVKKAPDFSDARFHIRAFIIAATAKRHAAAFTLTVMFTRNIVGHRVSVVP
jgi:hypothetical protein